MTPQERQAIIFSAFAGIRCLVPTRWRKVLNHHIDALTAVFNDYVAASYEAGRASVTAVEADAYQRGRVDGIMSIRSRFDHRDELDVLDPPELRSVH